MTSTEIRTVQEKLRDINAAMGLIVPLEAADRIDVLEAREKILRDFIERYLENQDEDCGDADYDECRPLRPIRAALSPPSDNEVKS